MNNISDREKIVINDFANNEDSTEKKKYIDEAAIQAFKDNIDEELQNKFNGTKLLITEDLNDLKLDSPGIYFGGSGNTCKNLPPNVIGFSLLVLRSAYSSVRQILYTNEEFDGKFPVYSRVYREYNGEMKWGEWEEIGSGEVATKLQTPRKISLGGDLVGSANFDGSGDVIINATNEFYVHQVDNTNNYPFHRFAFTETPIVGNYLDNGDVFMIVKGFDAALNNHKGGVGIFQVKIRTNSIEKSSISIYWLVRDKNIPIDCIQAGVNTTHGSTTVDLFYKNINAYEGCNISRISNFARVGCTYNKIFLKMCRSEEKSNTTTSDKNGSIECYKTLADAATELGRTFSTTITATDNGNVGYANYLNTNSIPENSNLNNYQTSGFYFCDMNAKVATLSNCPTDKAFFMVVGKYGDKTVAYQEITEYLTTNPKKFMRNFYNGTWGEWYRVYTTADPPGVTASGNIEWSNINNKPTIPTKTSQLTNDSGFIDNSGGNIYGDLKLYENDSGEWGGKLTCESLEVRGNNGITCGNFWITPNDNTMRGGDGISIIATELTLNGVKWLKLQGSLISCINSAGNLTPITASAFNTSSSRRVKENITDMTEEEARKILDVDVVGYDYINGDKNQYGLIAEDAAKIIPNIVSGDVNCDDADLEAINSIGIDYSKAVPYLIKMIQMMEGEIEGLKNTISGLINN